MLDKLRMFGRYAFGLRSFLKHTLTPEECRQMIEDNLQHREENFLRILERGIYGNPKSPYRKLLAHAGTEFGDIARSVCEEGIEGTLERLYDAGVYVTLDEFKGRAPIQRPGLVLDVQPKDFDNPLLTKHYESSTGGSRGVGTRIRVDFDFLAHRAAYEHLFLKAFHLLGRPIDVWRPVPPAISGLDLVLCVTKVGHPIERWFAQNAVTFKPGSTKYALFTSYAVYGSRLYGRSLPVPKPTPLDKADLVARWLATKREKGTHAVLFTNVSSAVRVCLVAQSQKLDISGTFFRVGGEPYTHGKARVLAEAGCKAAPHYAMAEAGILGIPCASPNALDDVHLGRDKLAVIQREKPVGIGGLSVGALYYTTLLPSSPKLLLNVDSGDYATQEERDCSCLIGEIRFRQHLHTIRSYEKLTSEGMTFLGSELITLVEEVLPGRFGGHPTDYQLVEEEEEGLPRVRIYVSPRVGPVNEGEIIATILRVLHSYPGSKKMMADRWREAGTLRVVRAEPHSTAAGKILPLHILREAETQRPWTLKKNFTPSSS